MPTPRVLIPATDIQRRVRELGLEIERDCGPGPVYLIGILKGSCIFLADLARSIQIPVRLEFIGTSSYGAGQTSSGEVRLTKDLDASIEGCDVIVVEDIVDTGITLTYLLQVLAQRKPRSLRVAAFLDKPSRRQRPVPVDYVGFSIEDRFVVGYGLDFAEDFRQLPDVCTLD